MLTCAAVLGGLGRNPQALPALLLDLAIRGHLMIRIYPPNVFRVETTSCRDPLRPEEILVKELLAAASPAPDAGPTLTNLRDSRQFTTGLRAVMTTVTSRHLTAKSKDRAYYHTDPARELGDSLIFIRLVLGGGGVATTALAWPSPLAVIGGAVGILVAAALPMAGPYTGRGRALLAGLDALDDRLEDLATSSSGSPPDPTAFEQALPYGVLLRRSLDRWTRLADLVYPDACPWLLGPAPNHPDQNDQAKDDGRDPRAAQEPEEGDTAAAAPATAATATAAPATAAPVPAAPAATNDPSGGEASRTLRPGELLRLFCAHAEIVARAAAPAP